MSTSLVVTHERLGTWARQLRPRLASSSTRLIETRSGTELVAAARNALAPLVVIDLADRPRAMLEDLAVAALAVPSGLFLVLDPGELPGLSTLARELGATLTLAGVVPPPQVAAIVARWLPIARRRAEADGWSALSVPNLLDDSRP